MLRHHILAIIEASTGIGIRALKSRGPHAKHQHVHNALADLRKAGAIESAGHGRYRATARPAALPAGSTQTAPMSRLMAGR